MKELSSIYLKFLNKIHRANIWWDENELRRFSLLLTSLLVALLTSIISTTLFIIFLVIFAMFRILGAYCYISSPEGVC